MRQSLGVAFVLVAAVLAGFGALIAYDAQKSIAQDQAIDEKFDRAEKFVNRAGEVIDKLRAPRKVSTSLASFPVRQFEQDNVIGERVYDLPEDGGLCWTTVFTTAQAGPWEQEVMSWFQRDPTLNWLTKNTKFHTLNTSDPNYRERFSTLVPPDAVPAVVVQDANGKLISLVANRPLPQGSVLTTDSMSLASRIAEDLSQRREQGQFNGRPPRPCPTPAPTPTPTPTPSPMPFTPQPPMPQPPVPQPMKNEDPPLWPIGLGAGFCMFLGVAMLWGKKVRF